jgi:hypothetical protein
MLVEVPQRFGGKYCPLLRGQSMIQALFAACFLIPVTFLFDPTKGGITFLRIFGKLLPEYTVVHSTTQYYS